MRIVVFANGTMGVAVQACLTNAGHEVVSVGRRSGHHQVDMTDIASLRRFFAGRGGFDAVACAAGDVFPAPLEMTTDDQWSRVIQEKGMGQINIVRAALPHIRMGAASR